MVREGALRLLDPHGEIVFVPFVRRQQRKPASRQGRHVCLTGFLGEP
jgi:hypothetical protein